MNGFVHISECRRLEHNQHGIEKIVIHIVQQELDLETPRCPVEPQVPHQIVHNSPWISDISPEFGDVSAARISAEKP